MITVLGMNPAMDHVVVVDRLVPGAVHRTRWSGRFAGGKGFNVARAVRRLGSQVRVVGFAGGATGAFLRAEGVRSGIDCRLLPIAGESRVCVILVDEGSGDSTVVNEPGPDVSGAEAAPLQDAVAACLPDTDVLVVSGSAPPGIGHEAYRDAVSAARRRGVPAILDASGPALRSGLTGRPWLVKPNAEEAAAFLGGRGGPSEACRALVAAGADCAVVSLGAEGALCFDGDRLLRVVPPVVALRNSVGSGDAFVAGLAEAKRRGWPLDASLRLAAACGALNAASIAPDLPPDLDLEAAAARSEIVAGA